MRGGGGDCLAIPLMKRHEQPGNTLNNKREARSVRGIRKEKLLCSTKNYRLVALSIFFSRYAFFCCFFCPIGDGHEKNGEHKLGTEKRKKNKTSTKNTRFFFQNKQDYGRKRNI